MIYLDALIDSHLDCWMYSVQMVYGLDIEDLLETLSVEELQTLIKMEYDK